MEDAAPLVADVDAGAIEQVARQLAVQRTGTQAELEERSRAVRFGLRAEDSGRRPARLASGIAALDHQRPQSRFREAEGAREADHSCPDHRHVHRRKTATFAPLAEAVQMSVWPFASTCSESAIGASRWRFPLTPPTARRGWICPPTSPRISGPARSPWVPPATPSRCPPESEGRCGPAAGS